MKKSILTLIALFFMVGIVQAASYQLQLTWDANTEADLAGYNVYELITDDGKIADDIKLNDAIVTATMYMVSGTVPDEAETTVCWAVTATDGTNNESEPSNTVCETFDTRDTTPPAPPTGLIGTLVELLLSFINWISSLFS